MPGRAWLLECLRYVTECGYGGAGGIGKLMAEWIVTGEPSLDIYAFRANRFGNYYANPYYATERTREGVKYLLPAQIPTR